MRTKGVSSAKSKMNWIFVGKLPMARYASSEKGTPKFPFIYIVNAVKSYLLRCRFTHDIPAYLAAKGHDLHIPQLSQFSDSPSFAPDPATLAQSQPAYPSMDPNTVCPVFAATGECR